MPRAKAEPDLFDSGEAAPVGLRYAAELISPQEEHALVDTMAGLPFKEFEFQGFLGKRRVVSFGWRYDFNGGGLQKTEDMPAFLLPVRARAAAFAELREDELQHVLLTEYPPGAQIGWHKDRSVFGDVVGLSLVSPCIFRLRRKAGGKWQRHFFIAEPRSAYLMRGASRTDWEHSIPAVKSLRYSITFRNFKPA
jgi:alkylated DNA repair dioxygenase AlkB